MSTPFWQLQTISCVARHVFMLGVNFDVIGIKLVAKLAIHILALATITCATPITVTV